MYVWCKSLQRLQSFKNIKPLCQISLQRWLRSQWSAKAASGWAMEHIITTTWMHSIENILLVNQRCLKCSPFNAGHFGLFIALSQPFSICTYIKVWYLINVYSTKLWYHSDLSYQPSNLFKISNCVICKAVNTIQTKLN